MGEHGTGQEAVEVVHEWDDDPAWQESVAVWFDDADAEVGGFFRFGLHPVQGQGRSMLFAFTHAGRRFRRVRERVPSEAVAGGDLAIGGCVAGHAADGRVRFSWDEPESSADLVFDAFHQPHGFGGTPDDLSLQQDVYSGHLECSGTLSGIVRIGDQDHAIRGLAHRDRSWGPRRIEAVLTNRMMTGTFGPELSFALNTIQLVDGTINNVGLVSRKGEVVTTNEFVILPSIHLDGYSVESGVAHVRLPDGDRLTITCETIDGQLTPFDGYLCSEHISIARCEGLVGFCDNELTNNPRLGVAMPPFPQWVDGGDGLSTRPPRWWR